MKTPASLLDRVRSGRDPDSWSQLVELYLPFICSWARQTGLQDADVADLAQEVFALLFERLPTFRYDASQSFRAWLRTVTVNKWRELCRRRGIGNPVPNGQPFDQLADDPAPEWWEQEHTRFLATRALQLMQSDFEPQSYRVCWQILVEERPVAAVAAETGLTPAAIYAVKSRVLRRLRQELQDLL